MAELVEVSPLPRFIVRGNGGALGLPDEPCRSAGDWALWLGPDEWLLLDPGEQLRAADGCVSADVSHRQIGLELRGTDAAMLLSGAVALDLSERAFPVGMCARTLFEKAEIVLWRRGPETWRIEVARSHAPYVRALLAAIAEADGMALS